MEKNILKKKKKLNIFLHIILNKYFVMLINDF